MVVTHIPYQMMNDYMSVGVQLIGCFDSGSLENRQMIRLVYLISRNFPALLCYKTEWVHAQEVHREIQSNEENIVFYFVNGNIVQRVSGDNQPAIILLFQRAMIRYRETQSTSLVRNPNANTNRGNRTPSSTNRRLQITPRFNRRSESSTISSKRRLRSFSNSQRSATSSQRESQSNVDTHRTGGNISSIQYPIRANIPPQNTAIPFILTRSQSFLYSITPTGTPRVINVAISALTRNNFFMMDNRNALTINVNRQPANVSTSNRQLNPIQSRPSILPTQDQTEHETPGLSNQQRQNEQNRSTSSGRSRSSRMNTPYS